MSMQPKGIWMPRDNGCLTDGEMGYDSSSRVEPKRGQWFMDPNGPQIFNKKQAIESVHGRPLSGVPHVNVSASPWDNTSGFQSVSSQCNDRLFGSDPVRTGGLVDRNIQSAGSGNMNMARKGFENQFGSTPSVGLSMSHTIEDPSPGLNFGGIRKVKVNQVRESDNIFTSAMGNSYAYNKNDTNAISLGPAYNSGEENAVSLTSAFTKTDESYISVANTFNKGDGNFISIGHNYNGNNGLLSMGQPYDKGDRNFISIGQSHEKGDRNVMTLGSSYNKEHDDFISMSASYGKSTDSFIPSYLKGSESVMSIAQTYRDVSSVEQIGLNYDKGESGTLSIGQNYNKAESTTISFGGFHEEPECNTSGSIISGYDLLMSSTQSSQTLEVSEQKISAESNADSVVNDILKSDFKADINGPKNKEPKTAKKTPPNNFPSNVKSLLSTGMFDGVPVKYVSWSRDKNLKGIIKGTGYLCSCAECNHSKALNAYEYERHAGCKTKHPNNHIYFENGKTIYAVVQELKNTPQESLFDAIQNVTGSPINQKNFRIWKASYQAATRELQRIYGKDEVTLPS